MYARLISFSGAGPDRREPTLEMIRGTVIPMLQSYDGFAGYAFLYDEVNSRAKALILWDSKDARAFPTTGTNIFMSSTCFQK